MNSKVKIAVAVSILPQFLLVKWMGSHPEWVENYYSEGIYPYISLFLRGLFGWIPFSVGDVFYTVLSFAAIRYLYLYGKNIWKKPRQVLLELGIVLSIAYFIFHLFWGMNYYRLPIHEKLGMPQEYSIEELAEFTGRLVETSNQLQYQLTKDSVSPVRTEYSKKDIFEMVSSGYDNLSLNNGDFEYRSQSLKKSVYSIPLSYMGYGGYLNPFTNEAQVNGITPILRYPTVSAHEIGHQIGYSSESATNFMGFLSSSRVDDPYFKYAAYTHALAYCLSDLRAKDEAKFKAQWDKLHPGVKENYAEINRFWKKYDNVTEPIFKWVWNAFLKANDQKEGIKSYNRVVGLLVNYDKKYGF